jgi:hypothetical protein
MTARIPLIPEKRAAIDRAYSCRKIVLSAGEYSEDPESLQSIIDRLIINRCIDRIS